MLWSPRWCNTDLLCLPSGFLSCHRFSFLCLLHKLIFLFRAQHNWLEPRLRPRSSLTSFSPGWCPTCQDFNNWRFSIRLNVDEAQLKISSPEISWGPVPHTQLPTSYINLDTSKIASNAASFFEMQVWYKAGDLLHAPGWLPYSWNEDEILTRPTRHSHAPSPPFPASFCSPALLVFQPHEHLLSSWNKSFSRLPWSFGRCYSFCLKFSSLTFWLLNPTSSKRNNHHHLPSVSNGPLKF